MWVWLDVGVPTFWKGSHPPRPTDSISWHALYNAKLTSNRLQMQECGSGWVSVSQPKGTCVRKHRNSQLTGSQLRFTARHLGLGWRAARPLSKCAGA